MCAFVVGGRWETDAKKQDLGRDSSHDELKTSLIDCVRVINDMKVNGFDC